MALMWLITYECLRSRNNSNNPMLNNDIEDKACSYGNLKVLSTKSHETYLKEEFPCIYRKFLLRQLRQNTFSRSVENNVKSKGGEELCRTYSIAFSVSGCREPIGNQFC